MRRATPRSVALCSLFLFANAHAATSIDHAIAQLVAELENGTPEAIQTMAIWQWQDDKLTEPLRRAFRDDLEIALINSRFQYFNRERFRQILQEHHLTLAQLAEPGAMKAAAAAGINAFLGIEVLDASCAHPEFKDQDTHCVLLAKLTDAKTATIAWAGYIEGANPAAIRTLLGKTPPTSGVTRYRAIATAVAASLKRAGLEEAKIKTITLSSPAKEGSAGIGIRNPVNAPFDLKTFQDEALLAIAPSTTLAYIDPSHIARLIAHWKRDSDAVAATNVQALAKALAIDGYLFGEIRGTGKRSVELSLRIVSLVDGSEAWAGKFTGTDSFLRTEPREVPQPPVPREDPKEPVELTLEDIERPLKPPVPQPQFLPDPEGPRPRQLPNPIGALLYLPIGLPRDVLDAAFLVSDRVPLLGAATSAVYRYGGVAPLCRLGTHQRFRDDVDSHRALTYGQVRGRDEFPTHFPLIRSARSRYRSTSNYLLQISLGTLALFDLFDATYSALDRTPALGTLTTPILLPLDYAWRLVPEDRDLYCPQVTPGRPESRLTFGSIDTEHPWSLFPNARSWPFTFATAAARREACRRYDTRREQVEKENETRLNDWRAKEEARRRYNQEALDTLRKRNREARRKYEQELARVRRDNQTDQQRYQREKQAIEDHNARAKKLNILTSVVFDLKAALAPPKLRRPRAPRLRRPRAPKPPAPKAPIRKPAAPKAPAPKAPIRRPAAPKAPPPKEPAPKAPAQKAPAPKPPRPPKPPQPQPKKQP